MMMRRKLHLSIIFFLCVVYAIALARRCGALSPDGLSLLAFKAAVSEDPSSSLAGWSEGDEDPCRWPGVSCANITGFAYPRVVGIAVSGKNLSGYIPSELGTLLFLRRLNLHSNRLSGPIPAQLFNASSLHSLFLYDNLLSGPFPAAVCDLPRLQNLDFSRNALSGPLPPAIRGCRQLQRLLLAGNSLSGEIPAGIWAEMVGLVQLDLSSNEFEGPIPPDLGELDSLGGTLNLSHNRFSGAIPSTLGNLPSTVSLDLRYNNLSGEIPGAGSLANQGPTAFLNNPGLCGFPLLIPCEARTEPAAEAPGGRRGAAAAASAGGAGAEAAAGEATGGMRAGLIVLISVADAAGVALMGLVVVCAYWKVKDQEKGCAKLGGEGGRPGRRWGCTWCGAAGEDKGEQGLPSSEDEEEGVAGGGGGAEGELVAMDKGFKVELEELLRASAYVLGKGGKGIVYKVVVGDGAAVAVRRLGEGGGAGGRYKEFAAEVRAMGRVRHPNLVRLRAYYWAPDEKLLITDFISNGNLTAALRGRSGHPSLSWPVRMRIARGAARGLAYLHDCSPRKLVHGDLKPSNILLDADFNPRISDFGLLRLLSLASSPSSSSDAAAPSSSTTGLLGAALPQSAKSTHLDLPSPYRAPEARAAAASAAALPTQKSDVYSFGVVLLEMLTGKPPEMSSPSPSSSSGEQVPGLVRWVRKGFEEARPLSDLADPVLLRDVHAKKELAAAFHVALACTDVDPLARPRMKMVSEKLDRIVS
ncbi:receptor protein kinase-like protein ZAR1 [Musa acuminata AAA Group]|uniref:receptor protein kinase-like protein ZAR1 n=1 Tax=Musa acuminata AAA Group TaxID=214697 RepID=UPI0031E17AFA